MPKRAKLNIEALEERTVPDATSPYASLAPNPADYGLYQPIYNYYDNGAMVQMVGWSATPVYSYYGGGIAYTPDALVITYSVVNYGNETSQGTNVVLYGDNAFGSLYGFGPTELATRYVGPLAPGQAFNETFVVFSDPSWSYFGPPTLSMSTYSLWTPSTIDYGFNDLIINDPFGGFFILPDVIGPNLTGNSPGVNAPNGASQVGGSVADGVENVAKVVQNLGQNLGQNLEQNLDDGLANLGSAALLMQQEAAGQQGQQSAQPVEQNGFQGLENGALQSPLDQGTKGKDGKVSARPDGLEDPTLAVNAEALEEAEVQLLFQPPKTRTMPNWLKKMLEENKTEEAAPTPENEGKAENDEQEEVQKKDIQVNVAPTAQTPARENEQQRSETVVNVPVQERLEVGQPTEEEVVVTPKEEPKAAARATEQTAKLVADKRENELSQQQAQMAYFILLGTGLAALQRKVRPDKAVADRENPRRKRLTRL